MRTVCPDSCSEGTWHWCCSFHDRVAFGQGLPACPRAHGPQQRRCWEDGARWSGRACTWARATVMIGCGQCRMPHSTSAWDGWLTPLENRCSTRNRSNVNNNMYIRFTSCAFIQRKAERSPPANQALAYRRTACRLAIWPSCYSAAKLACAGHAKEARLKTRTGKSEIGREISAKRLHAAFQPFSRLLMQMRVGGLGF